MSAPKHYKEITGKVKYADTCDYDDIIKSFGDIIDRADDDDYQGDSFIILSNSKYGYGYLEFGWGSCSGCDALQGCNSIKEFDDLVDELWESITWQKSKQELIDLMLTWDVKGKWVFHSSSFMKLYNRFAKGETK